ncbi:ubiquitin carboxyl-terminal hydrolase [Candidatus Babela massiliensis]|uniref:Ubiquitin carboxyl-terminal hydrolase peptidase C19 n=1 Tax=Candidatus Babela massiliensis TaxID=673862 RepID=V6DJP0_9BACT|nr:ubiquitin carboxyl-terminal hydrolase [Candidatus Babela massiliensis]CDK30731.1 Ubiquitin carboxyl-terminal hydrolase peptidase C19 [Candidatus Babela massiliensis]
MKTAFRYLTTLATLIGVGSSLRIDINKIELYIKKRIVEVKSHYNLQLEEDCFKKVINYSKNLSVQGKISIDEAKEIKDIIEQKIRKKILGSKNSIIDFSIEFNNTYYFNSSSSCPKIINDINLFFKEILKNKFNNIEEFLQNPEFALNVLQIRDLDFNNITNNKVHIINFNNILGIYPKHFSNLSNNFPREKSQQLKGLTNLGNTCFINALLQSIKNISVLRDTIISLENSYKHNSISKALIDFLHSDNKHLNHKLVKLRQKIHFLRPEFANGEIADSLELINSLINNLTDEDLIDSKPIELKNLFHFKVKTKLLDPKTQEVKVETPRDIRSSIVLSISKTKIEKPKTINDLEIYKDINSALKEKYFRGITPNYNDEEQNINLIDAPEITRLISLPKVLIISLERYFTYYDNKGRYKGYKKIYNNVDFPFELDMSPYCELPYQFTQTIYKLNSIIMHHGEDRHYTAYVKKGDLWYHYNDDRKVEILTEGELKRLLSTSKTSYATPYILFYEQKESSDNIKAEIERTINLEIENPYLRNILLNHLENLIKNNTDIYQIINRLNNKIKKESKKFFKKLHLYFNHTYIKKNNEGAIHFLINYPSNPVLISIVKMQNLSSPIMLINHNAKKYNFDNNTLKIIKKLHNFFIKPHLRDQ